MNILSLFNGISGLHLAFDRVEIPVSRCYYAEIDRYANAVTEKQYPADIPLGDVMNWREWDIDWSTIDFVSAGFPCQPWSISGSQMGDEDERGMLFWVTLEIISKVLQNNSKANFLIENVKMKKEFEKYITEHTTERLGYVEKTLINSALVSAQKRERYYWTNFKVSQPLDQGIILKDILERPLNEKYMLSKERHLRFKKCNITPSGQIGTTAHEGKIGQRDRVYTLEGKMITLTATMYKQPPQYDATMDVGNKTGGLLLRKHSPIEFERLQTLPDNWTDAISDTQRYKAIGNGWTIDVIAHILKGLKEEKVNEIQFI